MSLHNDPMARIRHYAIRYLWRKPDVQHFLQASQNWSWRMAFSWKGEAIPKLNLGLKRASCHLAATAATVQSAFCALQKYPNPVQRIGW